MHVDEAPRFPASRHQLEGDMSSQSDPAGQALKRRYSLNVGASSSRGHEMAMQTRRPLSVARPPQSLEHEVPRPPIAFRDPPPLAPYVTDDKRVHAPRVEAWGAGPDPGLHRHQSNPHLNHLPAPVHRPPKNDNWKRHVERESIINHHHPPPQQHHNYADAHYSSATAHGVPQRKVHPPPMQPEYRPQDTLPPLRTAIPNAASSMKRTFSNTSGRSAGYVRSYSRPGSHAGSSTGRPSSHGSSQGDDSLLADGLDDGASARGTGRRRTRALMTKIQQQHLKQLWKETKFPGNQQREELGNRIGLTTRQVQVWFQNQRQKARKEINETGVPAGADPRDWDDLDKSPRSRRLSLEAAEAAAKVAHWTQSQSYGRGDGSGAPSTSPADHYTGPDARRFLPLQHGQSLPAQPSWRPHADRPPGLEQLSLQWQPSRHASTTASPATSFAMSPLPLTTPSPTRQTFSAHEQRRPPPMSAHPSSSTHDPYRSPVNHRFGSGAAGGGEWAPAGNAMSVDGAMSAEMPRRRSNSMEGIQSRQTPSRPSEQQAKRSRTLTVNSLTPNSQSHLPPSIAALTINAPVNGRPDMDNHQLPRLGLGQSSSPTLPPPRGPPDERMNGQYRGHSDSTQLSLARLQDQSSVHGTGPLPGYSSLFRPSNGAPR